MKKSKKTLILALAALLCLSLSGCASGGNPPPEENAPRQEEQSSEAEENQSSYYHSALKGAVIVEQDGSSHFTYQKKCESCGTLQSGTVGLTASGGTYKSGFACYKCGENQEIEIQTTRN